MTQLDIKVGDRLRWRRQDDKGETCTVLAVSQGGKRAKLRVDGWLGTHWEKIDYHFSALEEVRS